MGFFDGLFERIGGVFDGGFDEILFFVLAFILLFNGGGLFNRDERSDEIESEYIFFFIVLFIMLLINSRDKEVD